MQIPSSSRKPFDRKSVESILRRENKFITDLLNIVPFPSHVSNHEDVLLQTTDGNTKPKRSKKQTSRAKSLVELQERIKQMTAKKGLTYKQKLLKKNLKAKLKKKNKKSKIPQKQNNTDNQTKMENKSEEIKSNLDVNQPLQANRMEFSKIDFSNIGKIKNKKIEKDPQKLLLDLRKNKTKLEGLRASGETDQANKIKEKQAWKNALARAKGVKVKDDEYLLAKSIKKNLQKQKQSKKKWESRVETVRKAQEDRQKKRQENIDKRKKTKKMNKLKKAVKKGKVIPGF